MGFDDADGVLNFMLKRANSFGTGVTDKTRVMCDLGEANDALPKGLVFDTILSDMSSLQFGVFGRGAVTGADVLKNLRTELRSEHMAFGTRRFVFCFDDRSYVTQAKMATQLERAAKAKQNPRTAPYENQIELAGADVSRTPLVGYSYALENKIPRDFARVMSTPTLLYKAIAFLCQLLATHFVNPCTVPIELVISGFRGQEADLSQTCTYLRRLAAGSLDANKLPVDTVVPDLEEPRMDAFCRVGESEGQCIYWVRKVLESSPPIGERRFLIRANDSDALAVALLNVPLFFDPAAQKLQGSLWFHYATSSVKKKRFFDVIRFWRRLTQAMHPLPFAVETVCLAAMLSGNDLCQRIPRLGPGTLLAGFDALLAAVLSAEIGNSLVRFASDNTGEMLIKERFLVAFIVAAYAGEKAAMAAVKLEIASHSIEMKELANRLKGPAPYFIIEPELQRQFLNALSRRSTGEGAAWSIGNKPVQTPDYELTTAHVRRAFFSLYYYKNIGWPERMLPAFMCDRRAVSLFGHAAPVRNTSGVVRTVSLSTIRDRSIATQPFLRDVLAQETRPPTPPSAPAVSSAYEINADDVDNSNSNSNSTTGSFNSRKRSSTSVDPPSSDECEEMTAEEELNAVHELCVRYCAERRGENIALYRKIVHKLRAYRRRHGHQAPLDPEMYKRLEADSVLEAVMCGSPSAVWTDIQLRNSANAYFAPNDADRFSTEYGSHLPLSRPASVGHD